MKKKKAKVRANRFIKHWKCGILFCSHRSHKKGVCPKCLEFKKLTRHHCLPKRFFNGQGKILLICRDCHDNLELLIPLKKKLIEREYYDIVDRFLSDPY